VSPGKQQPAVLVVMTLRNRPVVIAVQHAGASTLDAISPVLSTSGVSEPPAGRAGMRRRSPIYSLVRDKVAPAGLACATNGVILEFPASRQASGEFTEPDQLPPGERCGVLNVRHIQASESLEAQG